MGNHSNRAFWGHPPVCVCDFYAWSRCCKWSRLTEHRSALKAPRASAVRLRDLLPALMKNKRTKKNGEWRTTVLLYTLTSICLGAVRFKTKSPRDKSQQKNFKRCQTRARSFCERCSETASSCRAVTRARITSCVCDVRTGLEYHLNTVTHRTLQ